jgi:hypothetical protein
VSHTKESFISHVLPDAGAVEHFKDAIFPWAGFLGIFSILFIVLLESATGISTQQAEVAPQRPSKQGGGGEHH